MWRLILWFVLGAVIVGAVSGMLGSGPERIRALVLFPVAFGMLTGAALAFAAWETGIRSRFQVTVLSCVLVSGGLLVVAREAYEELVSLARDRVREDNKRLLGLQLLEDQAARDPAYLKQYLEQRMATRPQFEDYLMGRVSALGIWRSPWPTVCWIVEVLLGTGAAGWLVWRMMSARLSSEGIVVNPAPPEADVEGALSSERGNES
jgi:hypothetical protein